MRTQTTTSAKCERIRVPGAIAVLAGLSALGCTGPDPFYRFASTLVRCGVERQECDIISITSSGTGCYALNEEVREIVGDVCVFPNEQRQPADICDQTFCPDDVNAPGECDVTSAVATAGSPVCANTSSLTQLKDVTVHSVGLDYANPINSALYPGILKNLTLGTESDPPLCAPPNQVPLNWLRPDSLDVSPAVSIGQVIPNSPACTAATEDPLHYNLTAAPIAAAQGGGTTATVTAVRGHARVGQSCFDEICVPQTLDVFDVDVADLTISGVALRKLRLQSVTPAPLTTVFDPDDGAVLGIAPGGLRLRAEGQMNGVDRHFTVTNATAFRVDAGSNFRLRGPITLQTPGPNGALITINIDVDANGTVATPQEVACSEQTGIERLFGFEDSQAWSSTQAQLSLVTSPVQQGCGALGVRGQGFMILAGAPFTTRGLATNQALSVNLFVPGGQPNPYWLGALQAHLSCPSGAVFNQYIGQVELTGKPVNHYSTLRFPLPSAVRTTLARPLDDCSFSFSLNVNATGNTWLLDRLRFTP